MPFDLFDAGIGPDGNPVDFRYFLPFLIFCGVGLLIWFYYWVEGRKRFLDRSYYVKHNLVDPYLNWLAVICFVGIPIALSRVVLPGFFFAWRFWRYLWLVALLVWAVLLVVYLVRKLPKYKTDDIKLAKEREEEKDRDKNKNKSNKQRRDRRLKSRSR
jgi:hypothetical protein